MVKTVVGLLLAFALVFTASVLEIRYVNATFSAFSTLLTSLRYKVQKNEATYDDGYAVHTFWLRKKHLLHVVLAHETVDAVDNELNEALGYLREGNCEDALPKVEILLSLSTSIPFSLQLRFENVF